MLLVRSETLPEGPNWSYELKLDGYRAIAFKSNGTAHLRSRNNKSFDVKYPRIVKVLGRPALALAICGNAGEAQKVAAEISKLSPNDTLWNNVQLPEIRAAVALERNQPAKSVDLLAPASPYEGAYLEAAYLRGLAYLRLNKSSEAVAEFQKIVDHKGASWGSRWQHPYWAQVWSLSYLGLARGFRLAGDTAKAKKAFQDFFELWKDADPRHPHSSASSIGIRQGAVRD